MYKSLKITRGTNQSSIIDPVPRVNQAKATLLAECKDIRIDERLQMLQILLGFKWLGETAMEVISIKPDTPSDLQQSALKLLNKLDIAADYATEDNGDFYQSWIQFAVNERLLRVFLDSEDGLTEFERGMLYGYPVAGVLAFSGIIATTEQVTPPDKIELFYLGGRLSKDYIEDAHTLFIERWDVMKQVAPDLIAEATELFEDLKKQHFKTITIV